MHMVSLATHMSSARTCRTLMFMEKELALTLLLQDSILAHRLLCLHACMRSQDGTHLGSGQLGPGTPRFWPPQYVKALFQAWQGQAPRQLGVKREVQGRSCGQRPAPIGTPARKSLPHSPSDHDGERRQAFWLPKREVGHR